MIDVYRKLLDLLEGRERVYFFLLLGLILVMGVFDLIGVAAILPFLAVVADPDVIERNRTMGVIYETLDPANHQEFLVMLGVLVFVAIIVSLAVKLVTVYAIARFSQMRRHHLSTRLIAAYLRQPYVWFLRQHTADLGKQALQEVGEVINSAMSPAMKVLAQIVSLIFLVAFLVLVDPVVALASVLVVGGIYLAIFAGVRGMLLRFGRIRYEANTQRFRISSEMMGGIKEVKLGGLENHYLGRFQVPSRRLAQTAVKSSVINEVPRYILEATTFGGMVVLVLFVLMREGGDLTSAIPTLGLFALAGVRMFPAIQRVYSSFGTLRGATPALDAVRNNLVSLRATGEPLRDGSIIPPMPLRHRLEMRGIRYAYPGGTDRAVLRGVDMLIEARTTIGIVGGTGAGKTTLVDLVLGLLTPDAGEIRVDGTAITPETRRAWQNNLGYVPQQIYLVDDTVAANIAFGIEARKIDHAAVERAARLAELHDFVVNELPEGYATKVGERGVRLSGGQRQRIGIARALYHDPGVLILDEATSALDNLTERAVMDAVRNLGHDKTIIMIAHRLSTVRGCDRIFLMEHGEVAASGTYDELIAGSQTFREMALVGVGG
ncbi:ABC transporter ATP-binding protein [Roseitranquillus sediminis]|uniref:ABC transporter ATP-binding protein n=1 Tax=Roseitranquillus sediminis TaxID=2809051 RepID=UPI001D0CC432|nr:ABC transporter ATP-binding protein [Roseitranquillus sediminis]MBM9593925.1 ABC transporter ATP-binding protein [Roseitranquillus sediminis]